MVMRKTIPAANPDAYVTALTGWQHACVTKLRAGVRKAGAADEVVKWGHLVYFANGPVALIRAEETRVLFGFWRGQRLAKVTPELKPGGKYEMATIAIGKDGPAISAATATRLMRDAVALNRTLGDPTKAAPKRQAHRSRVKAARKKGAR
jgi:hypothetical protein